MAQAPITKPFVASTARPEFCTRPQITDGSNTFTAFNFVYVTSNALAQCPTNATTVYGLVLDPSHAATDEPYDAPFGQLHEVVDTDQAVFVVNITDGSGNIGSGSTTQEDVAIGSNYELLVKSGGDYDGYQFLDSSASTNVFFRVEGRYELDAATDFNGRVYASVVATRQ